MYTRPAGHSLPLLNFETLTPVQWTVPVDAAYSPNIPRSAVDTFPLKVVGGTFTVAEVLLAPGQNPGQVVESIRNQPSDRWLVMAGVRESEADALAFINDAYECEVVALGNLKAD